MNERMNVCICMHPLGLFFIQIRTIQTPFKQIMENWEKQILLSMQQDFWGQICLLVQLATDDYSCVVQTRGFVHVSQPTSNAILWIVNGILFIISSKFPRNSKHSLLHLRVRHYRRLMLTRSYLNLVYEWKLLFCELKHYAFLICLLSNSVALNICDNEHMNAVFLLLKGCQRDSLF